MSWFGNSAKITLKNLEAFMEDQPQVSGEELRVAVSFAEHALGAENTIKADAERERAESVADDDALTRANETAEAEQRRLSEKIQRRKTSMAENAVRRAQIDSMMQLAGGGSTEESDSS